MSLLLKAVTKTRLSALTRGWCSEVDICYLALQLAAAP
jgi:hypothetical protein